MFAGLRSYRNPSFTQVELKHRNLDQPMAKRRISNSVSFPSANQGVCGDKEPTTNRASDHVSEGASDCTDESLWPLPSGAVRQSPTTMATFLDAGLLVPLPVSLLQKAQVTCAQCHAVMSMGLEQRGKLPRNLCCDFCAALFCTRPICLESHDKALSGGDVKEPIAAFDTSCSNTRQRYGWACPCCWGAALIKVLQ